MRSDEVFSKALAEVSDEAVEDDIEVVIQEPKMWKESWTKKIGLHLIAQLERVTTQPLGSILEAKPLHQGHKTRILGRGSQSCSHLYSTLQNRR